MGVVKQNLESSLPSDVLLVEDGYRLRPGNVACGERRKESPHSRFCFRKVKRSSDTSLGAQRGEGWSKTGVRPQPAAGLNLKTGT